MKLELTPEVVKLLQICMGLLSALIVGTAWLIVRLVKGTLYIARREAVEAKKWEAFNEGMLLLRGDNTPEHPGIVTDVAIAKNAALAAAHDFNQMRELMGITDSKLEVKKVELMREALGIRHRALQQSDLPPPAKPALRTHTPYRTGYRGKPDDDPDDKG